MKLLLDECVPRRLRRDLTGYEVVTVQEAGFTGLKNGELLRAAKDDFFALITVDQNIEYQQNTGTLAIAVVVLSAAANKYEALAPLVPAALEQLRNIGVGQIVTIKK